MDTPMGDLSRRSHNSSSSSSEPSYVWPNPPSSSGISVGDNMAEQPMPIEQPPICLGEISPQSVVPMPFFKPTTTQPGESGKIRKKPGRKPNPASPALRKAQNRAAQRAFRERKERHLHDLETTIKALREQRNAVAKELNITKRDLDALKTENWYLKGLVLTLQFVCMHHNIHIPTHSPYLAEEALSEMAHSAPHTIESYVNAYTLNNINLKPAMASYFSVSADDDTQSTFGNDDNNRQSNYQQFMTPTEDKSAIIIKHEEDSPPPQPPSPTIIMSPQQPLPTPAPAQQHQRDDNDERNQQGTSPTSLSAVQKLRLQLRVQSGYQSQHVSKARLQPTLLQLAIPHDPRIDLVPAPHMRDRMIIFRDQMDYDRCFSMLLNGAVQHGGDPTLAESWELPPEFFNEFWYLTIDYDIRRTNKWRRLKGLPEIKTRQEQEKEEHQQKQQQHYQKSYNTVSEKVASSPSSSSSLWTDDVLAQFIEGMPQLQPIMDQNHPYYHLQNKQYMLYQDATARSPTSPDAFQSNERSPSIGGMLDLMSSLSTTDRDQHLHHQHSL
ncbi:hypothetical protein BX666DRAFT_1910903 [Dichotomocladium elegans]|nr:hypothetical protein BX666DRAFT_1910903 [Dichotomocladium elegans]